jgi:uncharacterized protein YjlB
MTEKEQSVPPYLVQIGESFEQKYKPVLDFEGWRLAMLRHSEATDRDRFNRLERHNETHEIFILTEGHADLLISGNDTAPAEVSVIQMRKNVAYNVLPGVWHHAILSANAHIILFEKANTSRDNSDYHFPDFETLATLREKIRIF